jgi:hypothetical protein
MKLRHIRKRQARAMRHDLPRRPAAFAVSLARQMGALSSRQYEQRYRRPVSIHDLISLGVEALKRENAIYSASTSWHLRP